MARDNIGTRLFGWCLPDMPISQHKKCIHYSFPKENPRECPCECHKDFDEFKKQYNKKEKK